MGDSAAPAPDPNWQLGEPAECGAPVEAAWTLDTEDVEAYTVEGPGLAMEPGGVGVVEVEGSSWLVWTPPSTPPRARPVEGGEARELTLQAVAGIVQADLDADGALDLILPGSKLEILWGFGTKTEEYTEERVTGGRFMRDVAVADFDADGIQDLVTGFSTPTHDDVDAMYLVLRRGLGDRQFGDPETLSGWGLSFDLTVVDVDADGDPDVYACNDFGNTVAPNFLLRNDAGALTLASDTGLEMVVSCMGSTWADSSASGALEVYVAATGRQILLRGPVWYDTAAARGLADLNPAQMVWGAALQDMDNDGRVDLLAATSDFAKSNMRSYPMLWYAQGSDQGYTEVGESLGMPQTAYGRGVVTIDLDEDGVSELIVGDVSRSPMVFRSGGCTSESWVSVDGPAGSVALVTAGGVTQAGQIGHESGWSSTKPTRAHFGLGSEHTIDQIELRPPGGQAVILEGPLSARRRVTWTP